MQTRLSAKGQVVLPGPLCRRLDIRAGDPLDADLEQGRIVLTAKKTVSSQTDNGSDRGTARFQRGPKGADVKQ